MESYAVAEKAQALDAYQEIFRDILSQAATGELIGMANFASLVDVHDDIYEKMDAVEHAQNERSHADAFLRAGARLGVDLILDVKAPYWDRIRLAFMKRVETRDLIACTLIQEVMLESFAISLYQSVAAVATKDLARVFSAIAAEEESHLEHAITMLAGAQGRDPQAFETMVHSVHNDVMTTLSEMVGKRDSVEHCGLCHGSCVKNSLPKIGLDIATLRGKSLNFYLSVLDRLGIRGEATLQWVAQLPA